MRQKLNLITLGVREFQRARDYYQKGLGWKPSRASADDIVFFAMGGVVLALYPREKLAEDAAVDPRGSGFPGITLSYNTKSQGEVDAVLRAAQAAGAQIVKPAQKTFWGGYAGYFADPDGFLWEVAWNPDWPLDAQDNVILP